MAPGQISGPGKWEVEGASSNTTLAVQHNYDYDYDCLIGSAQPHPDKKSQDTNLKEPSGHDECKSTKQICLFRQCGELPQR